MSVYIHIYIYIYIYTYVYTHVYTPSPPIKSFPINIARLKLSGRYPMGLGIPPHKN